MNFILICDSLETLEAKYVFPFLYTPGIFKNFHKDCLMKYNLNVSIY